MSAPPNRNARALLAREQADRLSIVQQIETLSGADAQDRIAELKVQWDALPPMPSEYAASLTRRFQDACRAFEDRERRRMLAEAAAGRLETLATELEQLLASEQPLEEVVARWRGLRRDADVLREHASANSRPPSGWSARSRRSRRKSSEHQQVRARQEQDNLRRLQQICRQVEALAAAEPVTLKAGDRALREIRSGARGAGAAAVEEGSAGDPGAPRRGARQARAARAGTARRRRVAALGEPAGAGRAVPRDGGAQGRGEPRGRRPADARAAGALEAGGARAARAGRGDVAPLQDGAGRGLRPHVRVLRGAERRARGATSRASRRCASSAEALADSTDWVKTATEIQALQAEWKTIGPVTRGSEKAVWERFRGACDRFFTRRQEDLKRRKEEWAGNLARKEALCEQAEALAESTDWENAAAQVKRLQSEWKTIGPVRKSKSEAVWQRFRAACDRFFDRYKHRDQLELQEKAGAREAVIRELEALIPSDQAPSRRSRRTTCTRPSRMRARAGSRRPNCRAPSSRIWPPAITRRSAGSSAAGRRRLPAPISIRKRRASGWRSWWLAVEELRAGRRRRRRGLSPAELLAQQWRERLAANTMSRGRRIAKLEESRWRAAEQEIRNAQSQWTRLGPVPADVAGPLNERFQRAVRQVLRSAASARRKSAASTVGCC